MESGNEHKRTKQSHDDIAAEVENSPNDLLDLPCIIFGKGSDTDNIDQLCEAIKHPDNIAEELLIEYGADLSGGKIELLCEALQHDNCKVKVLQVIDKEVYDLHLKRLSELLVNPKCKLFDLCLSNKPPIVKDLISPSNSLECKADETTESESSSSKFGDGDLKTLCEVAIEKNHTMDNLYVEGKSLTTKDVGSLCEILKNCKLYNLHLKCENALTSEHVSNLIEALENENCTLNELSINMISFRNKKDYERIKKSSILKEKGMRIFSITL